MRQAELDGRVYDAEEEDFACEQDEDEVLS